mgnify:CR=1 FL=1
MLYLDDLFVAVSELEGHAMSPAEVTVAVRQLELTVVDGFNSAAAGHIFSSSFVEPQSPDVAAVLELAIVPRGVPFARAELCDDIVFGAHGTHSLSFFECNSEGENCGKFHLFI